MAKEDRKLHKTYWEWQRYKQKETQRLLKKLTDERKIHRIDNDKGKNTGEPGYRAVDLEIDSLVSRKDEGYNPYEHLKSIRDIKSLESEIESPPNQPIEESSLVGPYDDPTAYEARKTVGAKAEKVVTKSRGRKKKKTKEDLSLFGERPAETTTDPRKKREQLIESLLDPLITLDDTATILNVCKTTVRRYTNKGVLKCIRTPGGQRRFKLSQVLDFMALQEQRKGMKSGRKG